MGIDEIMELIEETLNNEIKTDIENTPMGAVAHVTGKANFLDSIRGKLALVLAVSTESSPEITLTRKSFSRLLRFYDGAKVTNNDHDELHELHRLGLMCVKDHNWVISDKGRNIVDRMGVTLKN